MSCFFLQWPRSMYCRWLVVLGFEVLCCGHLCHYLFGVIKLLTGWLLWHICLYFQLNAILFIGMTIAYQHCVPLPCMLHGLISCPMSTTFFARLPYVRCIINLCPSTSGGTQYCWQKVFGLCCPAISFLHLDVSFTLQLLYRTLLLLLPILLIRWTGASMTKCLNIPRPPPFFFLFLQKDIFHVPLSSLGIAVRLFDIFG